MKKNHIIKLLAVLLLTSSLSSCGLIIDIIDSVTNSTTSTNISDPTTSYDYSNTSIDVVDGDTPAYVKSTYTYKDVQDNNYYDLSASPSLGTTKLLVIPVWFIDSETYILKSKREDIRSDIEAAYFGSEEDTGWHSVSSYYALDSFSRLNITGVVAPWYECGKSSSSYYSSSDYNDPTMTLVVNAVNWYKNQTNQTSLSDFDQDNDGYLDGVMLIYAAPDYDQLNNNNADNLWAYCYWIQDSSYKNKNNPGPNVFFWASYDFMYSSTTARTRTGKSAYGGGDTSHCSIDAHTYIHEMGHVFGLDDYYDYASRNAYNPAGGFSMQDYNVGAHDPFSRISLGWVDPLVPTATCTFTINTIESSGNVVLLSPSYSGSPFDEYILLELYSPTRLNYFDSIYQYCGNYPQGPSISGIRIWHIDARLYSNTKRKVTTSPLDGGIEQATSNTSSGDYVVSYAGSTNYNLNQLIRKSTTETYKSTKDLSASDLFTVNDTFSLNKYSRQFVNSTRLNNGKSLGWSVEILSTTSTSATIKCIKG